MHRKCISGVKNIYIISVLFDMKLIVKLEMKITGSRQRMQSVQEGTPIQKKTC